MSYRTIAEQYTYAVECAKKSLDNNRFFVARDSITDARIAHDKLLVAAEFVYMMER